MVEVFSLRADSVRRLVGVVAIFDARRGQVIYRDEGHGVDAHPSSKDRQGNLVLVGPHAAVSADGPVAVEYFLHDPADGGGGGGGNSTRDDAVVKTTLWDPYDSTKNLEFQYDKLLTQDITVAEGCRLEMSYAVLSSAVEATVQVDVLLSPVPHDPTMFTHRSTCHVNGEITAHTHLIKDDDDGGDEGVSILLFRRERHEPLEVLQSSSSFAGYTIPLARSVLAWPCGSPLVIKVGLQPAGGALEFPFDDIDDADKIHLSPLQGIGYVRVSVNVAAGANHQCLPPPLLTTKMDLLGDDSVETDLLVVHPGQLRFTQEPNNRWMHSLLHIRNDTDDKRVAFRLRPGNELQYCSTVFGILPPNTTWTSLVRLQPKRRPLPNMLDALHMTLQSWVDEQQYNEKEMDEVKLKAVVCDPADVTTTSEPIRNGIQVMPDRPLRIDLHPTEPWIILASYGSGSFVRIWDYENQAEVASSAGIVGGGLIWSIKFIDSRQWFIAGGTDGYIYVYTCDPIKEVHRFEAHKSGFVTSLAVHPSEPLVMSASMADGRVELWKWPMEDNKWTHVRTFQVPKGPVRGSPWRILFDLMLAMADQPADAELRAVHLVEKGPTVQKVVFNPKDANAFASLSGNQVQLWDISSPDPLATLDCRLDSSDDYQVACFDYFFPGGDRLYMVTGSDKGITRIWDLQNNMCITQVEGGLQREEQRPGCWKVGVIQSQSHLGRPILATASHFISHVISLYDCMSYRCEGLIDLNLGVVKDVLYAQSTKRLAICCEEGTAVMAFRVISEEAASCPIIN